jgi:hypothetical protein
VTASVPYLAWHRLPEGEELAPYIGYVLDELADFALDHGCPASELEERLEEAIDRHEEVPT